MTSCDISIVKKKLAILCLYDYDFWGCKIYVSLNRFGGFVTLAGGPSGRQLSGDQADNLDEIMRLLILFVYRNNEKIQALPY